SSDSRGGGLSVTVHAIPFQRKTKTRLRTPGAAGVSSAPEGRRHKPMIFHLPALRTPQKTPASLSPAISRLPSRHPSISLGPLPRSLIAWLRIGVDADPTSVGRGGLRARGVALAELWRWRSASSSPDIRPGASALLPTGLLRGRAGELSGYARFSSSAAGELDGLSIGSGGAGG